VAWQKKEMKYLTILLILLFISSCNFKNVRHKIGITTKPFQKNDGFENSTKFNYSIIFGVVRPKEDTDD
jgi:PBP1b-binding outer membrane lipoprotein LpoB